MQIIITMIGVCMGVLLLWYIYILIKGDEKV